MALIDKDSLKANIIKRLGISGEKYLLPAERALWNVINAEPTQEIIHCKDCKRFKKPSAIVEADWGWCSGWHMPPAVTFVKGDGFCYRAEKKGVAE